jgi:hypothetical protein
MPLTSEPTLAGAEPFLRLEAFLSQPLAVQQSRKEVAQQYARGRKKSILLMLRSSNFCTFCWLCKHVVCFA